MQGKESEKTFGLNRINLGARTVNPTTGVLDRMDRFANAFNDVSPYQYSLNNPILYIDPDGDSTVNINDLNMRTFDPKRDNVQLDQVVVRGSRTENTQQGNVSVLTLPIFQSYLPTGTKILEGLSNFAARVVTVPLMVVAMVLTPTPAYGPAPSLKKPFRLNAGPAQDKMLTPGEIERLEDGGVDVHELKGNKRTGQIDLYKRSNGDIVIKPKGGGKMEGEETGYNIDDF